MSISFLDHVYYQKNNEDIYFNGRNTNSSVLPGFIATVTLQKFCANSFIGTGSNISYKNIIDLCNTNGGATFVLLKSKELYGMGTCLTGDGLSFGSSARTDAINCKIYRSFNLIDTGVIKMLPLLSIGIIYFKSNGDIMLSQNYKNMFVNTNNDYLQKINDLFSDEDLTNINNIKTTQNIIYVINNKDDGTCSLHFIGKYSYNRTNYYDATIEVPKHVKKVVIGSSIGNGFAILYTDGTVAVSNGTYTGSNVKTYTIAGNIGCTNSSSSKFMIYDVNISDVDDIWMYTYVSLLFKMKDGSFKSVGRNTNYSLCAGITNINVQYYDIITADSINTLSDNEGGIKEILASYNVALGYLILTNADNIYIINDSTNTNYCFMGSVNGTLLDTDVRSITKLSRPGYFITANNNKGYYYDEENSKTVEFDLSNKADIKYELPSSLESINNIDKSILSGEFKINKIE